MKKSILIFGLIAVLLLSALKLYNANAGASKDVLFIVSDKYYDHYEFTECKKTLEDKGVKVIVASTVTGEIEDTYLEKAVADILIKDAKTEDYKAIAVIGGSVETILGNEDVNQLLQKANKKGMFIAGICRGASVMAESGILNGKEAVVTYRPKEAADHGVKVVGTEMTIRSGNIFTAQSKAIEPFANAILEELGIKQ